MSPSSSRRLAWSLVAVGVVLVGAGMVIVIGGQVDAGGDRLPLIASTVAFLVASVVGGLVASKRPENPIGWLFCGFSLFNGFSAVAAAYTLRAIDRGTETGAARYAAWFANWSYLSLFVVLIFVLLLFPDGRLPSPRWRIAAWCGAVGIASYAVAIAFGAGPLAFHPEVENPLGVDGIPFDVLRIVGMIATIVALGAGVASVVFRYRSSDGIARLQIKWLVPAGTVALTAVIVGGIVAASGRENAGSSLFVLGVLPIPVAVGIAMLRYRLYDVDRVISRTLTYGMVTVVLGAMYVGLVLLGQGAFAPVAGGGDLTIAVSTLIVAALFLPVRSKVQGFVDRRFYRRRYDSHLTLAAFGLRLRDQIELEALATDLQRVVGDTMQPERVFLWLPTRERP